MNTAGFQVMVKPGGSMQHRLRLSLLLCKEHLYSEGRHRLSDAMSENYVRQVLEGPGEVSLAWQGGRPTLLGFEFYHLKYSR